MSLPGVSSSTCSWGPLQPLQESPAVCRSSPWHIFDMVTLTPQLMWDELASANVINMWFHCVRNHPLTESSLEVQQSAKITLHLLNTHLHRSKLNTLLARWPGEQREIFPERAGNSKICRDLIVLYNELTANCICRNLSWLQVRVIRENCLLHFVAILLWHPLSWLINDSC